MQTRSRLRRNFLGCARLTTLRALLGLVMVACASSAWAQGGPPLITDDPGTPGDGHWEINLAAIAEHTPGRWAIAAPDADINYGWGDHIQLKADLSWAFARETGQPTRSGLGITDLGVKWRFLDEESSGVSMSTYPQLALNLAESSPRRGVTEPGHQLLLPIEAAKKLGSFEVDGEVGRNIASRGPDSWVAGAVVAHACPMKFECLAEVHESFADHQTQSILNLGFHRPISEALILLGSVGHGFGPAGDDHQNVLLYFGLQMLR